jgi:Activator of Hsp90 ATPase homolog 1-like protein
MSRMTTESPDVQTGLEISSMKIQKEIFIEAPIDIAFESVLDQLGPESQMPDGKRFPFKIEPFPGGRWFRDLGNNTGHLWGHVQVIKPPKLIELSGPFMMSFAATNHAQYRLESEGKGTRLKFTHQAIGLIPAEHRDGMPKGFEFWLERIRDLAERRKNR